MAMKPILFYQLTKYSLELVGITSESRHGRVNGRYIKNDAPAHWRSYDLIGKFDTLEAAQSKIAKLNAIRNNYKRPLAIARRVLIETEAAEQNEINAELKT